MKRLDAGRLREPLRAHLAGRAPRRAASNAGTAAAVLVPLFERHGDVHVWLVRRAAGMRSHGGQVAFPGGKRDSSDASLAHTALRETEEEIGLQPAQIDLLGALDDYVTVTRYVITPFVAWVPHDAVLRANPAEVARVFAAPLRRFVEAPTPMAALSAQVGYVVEGELVWGATAAVARRLGALVRIIAPDARAPSA